LESKVHIGEADDDADSQANQDTTECEILGFGRAVGQESTGFILSVGFFVCGAVFIVGEVRIVAGLVDVVFGGDGVVLRAGAC